MIWTATAYIGDVGERVSSELGAVEASDRQGALEILRKIGEGVGLPLSVTSTGQGLCARGVDIEVRHVEIGQAHEMNFYRLRKLLDKLALIP